MENSEWRLPPLNDEQKHWVIDARASGLTIDEIAVHFIDMFRDFATDIPEDVRIPLLAHRLKRTLNSSQSSAKHFLEAKEKGEIPTNIEAIPITQAHIRLLCYQRLWDETPARTIQRYIEVDGEQVAVYRENTRERLSILSEIRKELELLGLEKTEIYNDDATIAEVIDASNLWDVEDANLQ